MKKLYKLLQLPYIIWLKNALLLFSILLFPTVLHAQCKAGFKYTVNGGKVKFGSTSTTTSGFPLKYQWSFDKDEYYYSGSDSAGWTYYDSDTYEVTLVVVDSAGNCRDTFTNDVIINVPDICDAGFTASVYNNNYPAAYFDATGAYRPRIKYIWSFGDGITDTLSANTMHEYYNGGTYNVCLVVWNTKTGCRDTTCKNVIIPTINKTNCKAEFYTNDSYAPGSIKFWSLSDCQTKHFWDFGDGYTSNEINPLHKFPKSGSYAVTLIAYGNALTLPDTIQKTVIFSGTGYCDAEFNYFNFENQFYINFPRLQATKFRLDFGDGTIITSPDKESDSVFMHTYKKKGTYIICLLKTDTNYNCSDTVCKTVTVKDPVYCYAGFSAYFDQNSRSVYLQNDTVFTGLSTALFSWDFGDGTSASGIGSYYTNHLYTKNGKYNVRLIVSHDTTNCADTVSKEIVIEKPIYKADINVSSWNNVDSFIVYLITYDETDSSLKAIDTGYYGTDVDTGFKAYNYTFKSLSTGTYFVKSVPAKSSSFYNILIPTYYDTAIFWQDATPIVLDGSAYTRYITSYLKQGTNPGGPGFIGGKVSQGANKREGEPLKDIEVMLLDENLKPVTHTYSDASGNFNFENIAFGKYEIYAEVPGVKTNPATATISATNPKVENVEVKVKSKVINTIIRAPKADDFVSKPKLYPNPVKDNLYLETDIKSAQNAKIEIYNITGQMVYMESINLKPGKQTIAINTTKLPAGTYMLQLKNALGTASLISKFVIIK